MNYPKSFLVTLVVISFVPNWSFAQSPAAKRGHPIKKESFGQTRDGKPVELYTLTNSHGMEVGAINYGGIIVSLRVPDKNGKLDDVVLGFDKLDGYLDKSPYRKRKIHPGWKGILAGQKQWPQCLAWRVKRI